MFFSSEPVNRDHRRCVVSNHLRLWKQIAALVAAMQLTLAASLRVDSILDIGILDSLVFDGPTGFA
jgi:hypothetical protein